MNLTSENILTLNKACRSIKVNYTFKHNKTLADNLKEYSKCEGYGENRGGTSWNARLSRWASSEECTFIVYDPIRDIVYATKQKEAKRALANQNVEALSDIYLAIVLLPTWPSQGNFTLTTNNTQDTPKMKSLFDKLVNTNKDAAVMAAQLTAGKTANDLIQSKLYASLPWYARLFAKKKDAKNNGLAKLATANIAVGLAQHFGNNDPRLQYISEAMLQDAMVALTRDSEMVEKFIGEITEAVKVPSEILEQFNQERE